MKKILIFTITIVSVSLQLYSKERNSIDSVLQQNKSGKYFTIARHQNQLAGGDPKSFFFNNKNLENLSFDISNNKAMFQF